MDQELSRLRAENQRLSKLAHEDWLTGTFNRGHTQEVVNGLLKQGGGIMLMIDVDRFKQINDRYGHIMGDRVLQAIAAQLRTMVFRTDVLGRIGGDEFVIFMPLQQEQRFVDERCAQIRERLRSVRVEHQDLPLSVTVAGDCSRPEDDYDILFDRVDQLLLEKKRARRRQQEGPFRVPEKGIVLDMEHIRDELSEQESIPGAYCQDYETFKSIYRFVERRLRRVETPVCIMLFTLTDERGAFPSLRQREEQMDILRDQIQLSLRAGDVFTRYTSCQFLVMVCGADMEQSEMIAQRITGNFERALEHWDGELLHHCYPLQKFSAK